MQEVIEKLGIKSEEVIAEVERLASSEHGESILEKVLSYSNILKDGRWTQQQYLKAVEYVTYRIGGDNMVTAYKKAFPGRLKNDKGQDKPVGTIRAAASIYDKGDLVQKIMTQVQVPLYVLMMNERVNAAAVLARLMIESDNERIQMESADKLLTHTKVPESVKIEMDVGIKSDDTLRSIDEKLTALADIAHAKIANRELTPVEVIES